MSNRYRRLTGAAVLAAAALTFGTTAQADGVKVGVLTCHVASGWGFVFGSSKALRCHYAGEMHRAEHYSGNISKFGVDLGYSSGAVIIWDVFAPHSGIARGALTGSYAGAQASAAVGAGAGANVLVGGLDRSITLQPVSIEGETGLNVAAGIGEITLHFEGMEGGGMMGPPPPQQ
jgi:hypothetical protein